MSGITPSDAAWFYSHSKGEYHVETDRLLASRPRTDPRAHQAGFEADALRERSVRLGDRARSGPRVSVVVLAVCIVIALIAMAANN